MPSLGLVLCFFFCSRGRVSSLGDVASEGAVRRVALAELPAYLLVVTCSTCSPGISLQSDELLWSEGTITFVPT